MEGQWEELQAPWDRRRYGCFSVLFSSNNQNSAPTSLNGSGDLLLTQLKSPGVWLLPWLWFSAFLETPLLFSGLWFQPQAGFLSLKWLSPPLGSAVLSVPSIEDRVKDRSFALIGSPLNHFLERGMC